MATAALLCGSLAISLVPFAAADNRITPAEEAFLSVHGPVRIVQHTAFPPLGFPPESDDASIPVRGINADLAQIMAIRLGYEVEFLVVETLEDALDALRSGEADVMLGLAKNPAREQFLTFGEPFLWVENTFWVDGDSPATSLPDLANARIGAVSDSQSIPDLVVLMPEAIIVEVPTPLAGVQAVANGTIDAMYSPLPLLAYTAAEHQTGGRPIAIDDNPVALSIGVRSDQPEIAALMWRSLEAVPPEERRIVYEKWTGYDLGRYGREPVQAEWPPYVLEGVFSALALAMVLAVWTYTVRRQVQTKTAVLRHNEARLRERTIELEEFAAIVQASDDIIIGLDADGRIASWNPGAVRSLGHRADEAIGHPYPMIVGPKDRHVFRDLLEKANAGRPMRANDIALVHANGSTVDTSTVLSPIRGIDGKTEGVAWVSRDITETKEIAREREDARRKATEVEQLRERNEFRTRLMNTVAHELNTPLTPIQIQLHMLRARLDGKMDREAHSVDVISRNVERLKYIVKDVLDVVRTDNKALRVRKTLLDLNVLVPDAAASFEDTARQNGVKLTVQLCDRSLPVMVDQQRIHQVVANLLSNALKFTRAGDEITVRTWRDGGAAKFSVTDTGAGMTSDQIRRLFQPFAQVHGEDGPVGGTGLGLYICKILMKAHDGQITCESAGPGTGTTFYGTLAAADAPSNGTRDDTATVADLFDVASSRSTRKANVATQPDSEYEEASEHPAGTPTLAAVPPGRNLHEPDGVAAAKHDPRAKR